MIVGWLKDAGNIKIIKINYRIIGFGLPPKTIELVKSQMENNEGQIVIENGLTQRFLM